MSKPQTVFLSTREPDVMVQTVYLPIDQMPEGDHWRIVTGSATHNSWIRVMYIWEYHLEQDKK